MFVDDVVVVDDDVDPLALDLLTFVVVLVVVVVVVVVV